MNFSVMQVIRPQRAVLTTLCQSEPWDYRLPESHGTTDCLGHGVNSSGGLVAKRKPSKTKLCEFDITYLFVFSFPYRKPHVTVLVSLKYTYYHHLNIITRNQN